ncbi:hypothetical protein C0995_004833 [Termitomyces sp. Mi166|nr:hypothetical protein C0995_004833 [Termitomyces sp. Mi166\
MPQSSLKHHLNYMQSPQQQSDWDKLCTALKAEIDGKDGKKGKEIFKKEQQVLKQLICAK